MEENVERCLFVSSFLNKYPFLIASIMALKLSSLPVLFYDYL
jgi:hypothetical protein